jgi:hypothetical protein
VLNTAAVFPPPLKVAICRIGADLGRGYRMVNRRTAIPPNRSTPLYRVVRVVRTAGQEETLQRVRTLRIGTLQVPSLQPSKSESLALNPVASIPRVAGSTGSGSYGYNGSYAVRVAWRRKKIRSWASPPSPVPRRLPSLTQEKGSSRLSAVHPFPASQCHTLVTLCVTPDFGQKPP